MISIIKYPLLFITMMFYSTTIGAPIFANDVNAYVTPPCNGADGSIDLEILAGDAPYTFAQYQTIC